ncbi:MAG: hypothetical protein ABGZ53_21005 [Fuerstiella sp.]
MTAMNPISRPTRRKATGNFAPTGLFSADMFVGAAAMVTSHGLLLNTPEALADKPPVPPSQATFNETIRVNFTTITCRFD